MITAIVQFLLPKPISLEEAARAFESTAPKYQGLRGLVRKYYLRSEDGRRAGGVYLWETRAAAEAVYNGEWKARVKQLYGSEPDSATRATYALLYVPVCIARRSNEIGR
jgi:Putative mono-oxygenase ydhR